MNKKSMSEFLKQVFMAAGAILFIMVAINIVNNTWLKSEDFLENTPCYQSVRQQAFLNTNVRLFTTSLKCPLKIVDVPSTTKKEELKTVIADEMLTCWETFGKGELELFKESTGKFCHICTHIVVPSKGVELKGTEFLEYLDDTIIQSTNPERNGKTYAQIIYSKVQDSEKYFTDEQMVELQKSDVAIIDTDKNKDYAMVFWYIKGRSAMENFYEKSKAATPGVIAAGAGVGLIIIGGKIIATAGIAVATTIGWPIALVGGSVVLGGGWIATTFFGYARETPSWMANTYIVPYDENSLSVLGCEIAET